MNRDFNNLAISRQVVSAKKNEYALEQRDLFNGEQLAALNHVQLTALLAAYKNDLNGQISLEYDFGSNVSLADYLQFLIAGHKVSVQKIRQHFEHLFLLLQEIANYPILSGSNLVLSMTDVYVTIATNQLHFIYLPIEVETDLVSDITELIDEYLTLLSDDGECVIFLHKLKMEIKKTNLNLKHCLDFMQSYQGASKAVQAPVAQVVQPKVEKAISEPVAEPKLSVHSVHRAAENKSDNVNLVQREQTPKVKKGLFGRKKTKTKKTNKKIAQKSTPPTNSNDLKSLVRANLVLVIIIQIIVLLIIIGLIANKTFVDAEKGLDLVKLLTASGAIIVLAEYLLYKLLLKRSSTTPSEPKREKPQKKARIKKSNKVKKEKKFAPKVFAKKAPPHQPEVQSKQIFSDEVQPSVNSYQAPVKQQQYDVIDEGTYFEDDSIAASSYEGTVLLDESSPEQVNPVLVMVSNGHSFSLSNNVNVIGRNPNLATICLNSNSVSNVHALITKGANNGFYLKDDDSKNGTYVNGQKLVSGDSILLKNGDTITFANIRVEFRC